ncbi:MAG TPA: M48 family metalloprotease [Bacteroidia bacterium]
MKKIKIILYFIAASISTNAQIAKSGYFHLLSNGAFPTSVVQNLQSQINNEWKERNSYKTSVAQKASLDSTIYKDTYLYNLLLSGEVLYNDSVGNYVNRVATELMKETPDLQRGLQFYIIRSSVVNSYIFDRGFIFITTGLIAQLESEEQLAFILAHQIAHYTKKHTTALKMMENSALHNRNEICYIDEYASLKVAYSESEENEADDEAFKMIKRSPYSLKSINAAFDLYHYQYLPFDDQVFDKRFFETDDFKLSDLWLLKEITPISSYETKKELSDQEMLFQKRRRRLESYMEESEQGKKKFVLPKAAFISARDNARFSVCTDYLTRHDYVNAIYSAFILLKKNPDNVYLQTIVSKALYGIAIRKSDRKRNPIPLYVNVADAYQPSSYESYEDPFSYESKEGNSQSLYYMFNKIEAIDLDILAISYTWNAYKKTGNKVLKPIVDSLFKELFICNGMQKNDFARITREELRVQDSLATANEKSDPNKYEKIRSLQTKQELNSISDSRKYAFITFFKDDEFLKLFQKNLNASNKVVTSEKIKTDLSLTKKQITKVVIVSPFYSQSPFKMISLKKDQEKCEQQRVKYINMLKNELKVYKVDYQFMGENDSMPKNMEEYNEQAAIHAWILEREHNGSNPDALVLNVDHREELAGKYGTPYFVCCGIKTFSDAKGQRTAQVFKVYNIVSDQLVVFDVKIENYIANPENMMFAIANCIKELAKMP